jgi:hypothetical protein
MFNKTEHFNQRRAINGSGIFRKSHRKSAWAKALYAAELAARYPGLSAAALARLVGAKNASYIRTALKLSASERAAVHCGARSLSSFHHSPGDRALINILQRCPIRHVFHAIDQLPLVARVAELMEPVAAAE